MNTLSALNAASLLDPRIHSPEKKRLQKKSGDGSNFSPAYIETDGDETAEELQQRSGEKMQRGYAIQLGGNSKVRQYSGNLGKISERIGVLQVLSSTFSDLEVKAQELVDFVADKKAVADFEDDDVSELLTLATEFEVRRQAVERHSKIFGAGDIAPDPLDLQVLLSAEQGVANIKNQISDSLKGIHSTINGVNQQFEAIKPELSKNSPGENEDVIDEVLLNVREELVENKSIALDGQANLDPTLVSRLLSWSDGVSRQRVNTVDRTEFSEMRQEPNEVTTR